MTRRVRLTDVEYAALIAASVAWDGQYMDEIDNVAQVRRERAAIDRALVKIRRVLR